VTLPAVDPAHTAVVYLWHGDNVVITKELFGDQTVIPKSGQQIVLDEGTQVCLSVENANPVWYKYSLSKVERSLVPDESELAPLNDLTALLKQMVPLTEENQNFIAALESRASAEAADEKREDPDLAWLIEYTSERLQPFRELLRKVEDARTKSELPERSPTTSGPAAGQEVGYVWAQGYIKELLGERTKGLEKEMQGWYDQARKGRDAQINQKNGFVDAKGNQKEDGRKFVRWTGLTLEALKAYGTELSTRATRIEKEFQADGVWSDCAPLGDKELSLRLSVKRTAAGTAKRDELENVPLVTVLPRYKWKAIDLVTGLGVVVTPGARTFEVRNGVVAEDPGETLIRPMASVAVPFFPFGDRGQNAWVAVVGASTLDLLGDNTKTGKVLAHAGLGLRISDILSLSTGATWGSRPARLNPDVTVGSPLPAIYQKLSDAVQTASRFGFFVQVALRGLTLSR
jgi:hypothetical protein